MAVFRVFALLNQRASHGVLDCSFLAGLREGRGQQGPCLWLHPQGGGFPASLKDPEMASRTQAGVPGHRSPPRPSSLPSRATEQLRGDQLSKGNLAT